MVPEPRLESTDHGLVPKGDGWFVVNTRDGAGGGELAGTSYCAHAHWAARSSGTG